MTEFSKDSLIDFLSYVGEKGLMNLATAQSRKASVNAFFSILQPEELQDIRKLDLDEVARRFQNLRGTEYRPESIKVYKGRVSNAINDFKRWKADPSNFKIANSSAKPSTSLKPKELAKQKTPEIQKTNEDIQTVVFPVPIRDGVVVRISGLPSDLSKAEAMKIANVIQALATTTE